MPTPKFNYVVELQRPFDLGDDIIATGTDFVKVKEWTRARAVLVHQQEPTWLEGEDAWEIKQTVEGISVRYKIHTVRVI